MKKFLILFAIMSFGCVTDNDLIMQFKYKKDHRTGLCFVQRRYNSIISNVPCTKEVEDQIKIDRDDRAHLQ